MHLPPYRRHARFGSHQPDLLISDYRLREQRSGLEAIKALRALLGQSLPALLITGDTAPDRLRDARDSEVILLNKPLSSEQLYDGLMAALNQAGPPEFASDRKLPGN